MVDADGLNAFEGKTNLLDGRRRPLVLTPHPGEMSRLLGISIKAVQADRLNVARRFSRDHGLVLVLKGNPPSSPCLTGALGESDGQSWDGHRRHR